MATIMVVEDNPTPPREENPAGYNSYQCSDGVFVNIGVYMPHQFRALCKALDLPHLVDDPRITNPLRRHEAWLRENRLDQLGSRHLRCGSTIELLADLGVTAPPSLIEMLPACVPLARPTLQP